MIKSINKYLPFDKIIIAYSKVMIITILIFGRPIIQYVDELLIYGLTGAAALVIPVFVPKGRNRLLDFTRLMYAAILFGVFYRTTGGTMFLLFDKFFDYQIVAFETAIYGMEPTLYIDRYLLSPIVNEIFSFCYFCYYLMIPAFLITIFVKREYEIIKKYLTAAGITYAVSFLLFFIYPIEGPRWHFEGQYLNSIDGYLFRHLVEMIIAGGAVRGGCMPSSHIAIALVIMMFCFKYFRTWGWVMLPINIGLAIGTFWGRFHYVTDVYVGIAIGLAAYFIVDFKYASWTGRVYNEVSKKDLKTDFVS